MLAIFTQTLLARGISAHTETYAAEMQKSSEVTRFKKGFNKWPKNSTQ